MTINHALESQCGDICGEGSGNRFLYHYPMALWSLEILGHHMNSEGGSHDSFSFTIMLTLISMNTLLPSHC